jgi:hypothetical protein
MIDISSIVNIVEKNTRIVEMNFVIKTKINFELFDRKSALYVKNSTVDQSITLKKSEIIRRSVFQILILNIKLV